MNTVMRTLGGALGGQLAATFIADNTADGLPTVTGFTDSYVLATAFLVVCVLAGPTRPGVRQHELAAVPEGQLRPAAETG